jgi:ArsR family transcriptional regulator
MAQPNDACFPDTAPSSPGIQGETNLLARMFGALANETRLRVLNLLIETPLCVKEIAQTLGLPHNNISQNLKLLHHAGLVRARREGTFTRYFLDLPPLYEQLAHCLRNSRVSFPQLAEDLEALASGGFTPGNNTG